MNSRSNSRQLSGCTKGKANNRMHTYRRPSSRFWVRQFTGGSIRCQRPVPAAVGELGSGHRGYVMRIPTIVFAVVSITLLGCLARPSRHISQSPALLFKEIAREALVGYNYRVASENSSMVAVLEVLPSREVNVPIEIDIERIPARTNAVEWVLDETSKNVCKLAEISRRGSATVIACPRSYYQIVQGRVLIRIRSPFEIPDEWISSLIGSFVRSLASHSN